MIYLDHAATTPTAPEARAAMEPYYQRRYGNASTPYEFGQHSRGAVENARKIIADTLGVQTSEIYFTSGGTESDNWALKATMEAYAFRGRHMITTQIEHHAIGNTCEYLRKRGFEVTELPVDRDGRISLEQLERNLAQKDLANWHEVPGSKLKFYHLLNILCEMLKIDFYYRQHLAFCGRLITPKLIYRWGRKKFNRDFMLEFHFKIFRFAVVCLLFLFIIHDICE